MHATFQPEGRSPKQVNGPPSNSHLKPASDSGQTSATFPPHIKGKKRERADHSTDPVKRERSSKTDDGDFFHYKTENSLKSEIARITEKGGVITLEAVEKLVQLMQPDRKERKMDLFNRFILVGVIAATERIDCLNHFVQLRGVPVLDEWLQDIHKGKNGDGNSSKDIDISLEEFLLVLLRALDKLPVNLHALQMCNIGRSVNHLRSHKNLEIQRKARSLVETWKKRVEAEMNSIDTKSGTTQGASALSSRSRLVDASHGGSRTQSGSEVAMKNSIAQSSASKTTPSRSSHGESTLKLVTSSPGPAKPASSPASYKESQSRISPDLPPTREDRSSSSNQSYNQSQSLCEEDVKSATAGAVTINKTSSISTHNRKSNSFPVTSSQKEISSGRSSSAHKIAALEKLSISAFSSSERVLEGPINEGNSHKLIVKMPNRVSSPSQVVCGGSFQDPTCVSSRASSPVTVGKNEQFVRTSKDKNDAGHKVISDMNVQSWENNTDSKDALTGTDEAVGFHAAPDEELGMTTEHVKGFTEGPQTNELVPGELRSSSFSHINALVESCAEENSSLSPEDDVGMNLLASVATGEMSRSGLVSPTDSTGISTHIVEGVCIGDEAKSKFTPEDSTKGVHTYTQNHADCDAKKHASLEGCSLTDEGSAVSKTTPAELSGEKNYNQPHTSEDLPGEEGNKHLNSKMAIHDISNEKTGTMTDFSNEKRTTSLILPICAGKLGHGDRLESRGKSHGDLNEEVHEKKAYSNNVNADGNKVNKEKIGTDLLCDEAKLAAAVSAPNQFFEGSCKKNVDRELDVRAKSSTTVKSESRNRPSYLNIQQTACVPESDLKNSDKSTVGNNDVKVFMNESERLEFGLKGAGSAASEIHTTAGLCSTSNDDKSNVSVLVREFPVSVDHKAQQTAGLRGSKSPSIQTDETMKCAAEASSATPTGTSYPNAKVINFDLNEGLSTDDGKYEEAVDLVSLGATTKHMVNSSPFTVNPMYNSHSASVTVTAAAKGPFVPREDLLKSKEEHRWKGSAATSAFRPAEPRKLIETPCNSTSAHSADASTSKNGRVLLDFDLNVPDERLLEEMASRKSLFAVDSVTDNGSGGLDLDLNRLDESNDNGQCSTSNSDKHVGFSAGNIRRDFDLNDGPGVDDADTEPFSTNQQIRGSAPPQLSSAGIRMNIPGLGGFSSWFPPGNSYSTVAIPSGLGEQQAFQVFQSSAPQRTFSHSGVNPFTPDVYRGSMLSSSSPGISFSSSPFQFPIFPYGPPTASYPVSATYADAPSGPRLFAPIVNSHLMGPVGSVTPQFQRPFMVNLSDNNTSGGSQNTSKLGRQGFDLNSGPGFTESEMRPLSSGQHSRASAQELAEEHARILKMREPDGGWENDNFRYRSSPWQ